MKAQDHPPSTKGAEQLSHARNPASARDRKLDENNALAAGLVGQTNLADEQLAVIASSIYRSRRRRTAVFDSALFGEPAWDMLLDLFIKKCRNERVSTTSLCVASGVPQSTGLRWIEKLDAAGLLARTPTPLDNRVLLVEMTEQGYLAMKLYVSDGVSLAQMPLPEVA